MQFLGKSKLNVERKENEYEHEGFYCVTEQQDSIR